MRTSNRTSSSSNQKVPQQRSLPLLRAVRCIVEGLERRTLLTAGVPDGYELLDTFQIMTGGANTSNLTLESGVEYVLKTSAVWETEYNAEFKIGSGPGGTDEDVVDGVDVGIKLDSEQIDGDMEPSWTNVSGNTFVTTIEGQGAPVDLALVAEAGILEFPPEPEYDVEVYGPSPAPRPPASSDPGGFSQTAFGADGGQSGNEHLSETGVRYSDGTIKIAAEDLMSGGYGVPFGQTRTWSNSTGGGYHGPNGNGWVVSQQPYVTQVDGDNDLLAIVTGGNSEHYFANNGNDEFFAAGFDAAELVWDQVNDEFTYTDSTGRRLTFNDFSTGISSGKIVELEDASGNLTEFSYSGGLLTSVTRTDSGNSDIKERWSYEYTSDDLIAVVTLQRTAIGNDYEDVRSVAYEYYTGLAEDHGADNGLKFAAILDPAAAEGVSISFGGKDNRTATVTLNGHGYREGDIVVSRGATEPEYNGVFVVISTDTNSFAYRMTADPGGSATGTPTVTRPFDVHYYRYYKSGTNFEHGLKLVFSPRSFARLAANVTGIDGATDTAIEAYADHEFDYDASKRVTTHVRQGMGTNGRGTYTFTYPSTTSDEDYNLWALKTVETLPDNNTNTVYSNAYGQTILKIFSDGTDEWATYYKYDGSGRLLETAEPSAMTTTTDGDPVLNDGSTDWYMRSSSGLVHVNAFWTQTSGSISETTAGGVAGYLKSEAVRRGRTTPVTLVQYEYKSRSDGTHTIYVPGKVTTYRAAGGNGEITEYVYGWYSGELQKEWRKTTHPSIDSGSNGPGTSDAEVVFYDEYGRATWSRDSEGDADTVSAHGGYDGYITHVAYDNETGAVLRRVVDVDTTRDSDQDGDDDEGSGGLTFTALPNNWDTRTSGGLHLVTRYELDDLGRPTKATYPEANETHVVYLDANHEVRTYVGYFNESGTYKTTEPIQVEREYRPLPGAAPGETTVYLESLTTSALPSDTSGEPDGGESLTSANIESLTRLITNDGDQVVGIDRYFDLTGVTYDADDPQLGTASNDNSSGNYHATTFRYDDRGRQDRTVRPSGTIEQTDYDDLGRPWKTWIGTSDLNLEQVTEREYDGGGVGDGNLTELTLMASDTEDRVTQYAYDWRNRQVIRKEGVEASEGTSVNRPITYVEYDNFSQPLEVERYDGDNVSITASTNGVPDRPSATLQGEMRYDYDDRGRLFRETQQSVTTDGVTTGGSLATDYFYDRRGNRIQTMRPGGISEKHEFDGAGRAVATYRASAYDDSWSTATDVANDYVIDQTERDFDGNGNVILTTMKERFHNADSSFSNGTGVLGNTTTEPRARTTFVASHYDAADRLIASVDVGTNYDSVNTDFTKHENLTTVLPSRGDTAHVTEYDYSPGGWLDSVIDPRAIEQRMDYDLLGRKIELIEAYDDGNPATGNADDDRKTTWTYDGSDHVLSMTAVLSSSSQETAYIYDVGTGSNLFSKELLSEVRYPDPSTGAASASHAEVYTYNRLGQLTGKTDRNGSEHLYDYDVVGRLLHDRVGTFGQDVDSSVQRLSYTYDESGRAKKFTSYDDDSVGGGNIVNEVLREYNGFGQVTTEYQEHDGAVNTGTSEKVEYAYTSPGMDNRSRLTEVTYPDATELHYLYNGTTLSDSISRVTSLADDASGTTKFETYEYLGLGTIVEAGHPENSVDLVYHGTGPGEAGDQYVGLDRFGRIIEQRYEDNAPPPAGGPANADYFKYGYDENGNRMYRENAWTDSLGGGLSGYDELYHADGSSAGYDNLDRLIEFQRGTLNGTNDTISSETRRLEWDLDELGNWDELTTNTTSSQTRSHNAQNQIDSISGQTAPDFDDNGNMIGDQSGNTLTYDAWNRLVGIDLANPLTYEYDALGRRIVETETIISFGGGSTNVTESYYNADWQLLEEHYNGSVYARYVWSERYIDAMVLRERDADANSGNGLEERLYVQSDANFNVTALVETDGDVVERYVYDPYGGRKILDGDWTPLTPPSSFFGHYSFEHGHQGGRYDAGTGLMNFRNRYYSTALGRWVQQDPIGYVDGNNVYQYVGSNPIVNLDPSGLVLDTLWDVLNVAHDAARIAKNAGEAAYEGYRATYYYYTGQDDKMMEALEGWEQDVEEGVEASVDGIADGTAMAIPVVPAGATKIVRAGKGTVYRVPGSATPSGKPYVGRHNKPDPSKTRRSDDGRDRSKAEVVDTYDERNTLEGRQKEQAKIDQAGLENLDNKRNEIAKKHR